MAFIVWTGGAGDGRWNTAANWWTPATGAAAVPGAGDDAWIPPGFDGLTFYGDTGSVQSLAVGKFGSGEVLNLALGTAITAPILDVYSGNVTWMGISTTLSQYGGIMTVRTTDAIGQFNAIGGLCYLDQHGTISAMELHPAATVDASRTEFARTISALNLAGPGGKMRVHSGVVTITGLSVGYRGGVTSRRIAA